MSSLHDKKSESMSDPSSSSVDSTLSSSLHPQQEQSPGRATPLAMAASAARDKLQASARDLMKNLEDYAKKTKSQSSTTSNGNTTEQSTIETALRAMFSSCTTGADESITETPAKKDYNLNPKLQQQLQQQQHDAHHQYSPSDASPPKSRSLDPTRVTPNNNRITTDHRRQGSYRSTVNAISRPPCQQRRCQSASAACRREEPPPTDTIGEHIYAQLFYDTEHFHQSQQMPTSVSHRLSSSASKPLTPQSATTTPLQRIDPIVPSFPKPFPVSTPARLSMARTRSPQEFSIQATPTFDDSISAISANTLEAMARTPSTQSRSPLHNYTIHELSPASFHHSPLSIHQQQQNFFTPTSATTSTPHLGALPSPFHRTNSTLSKHSASTRTTQSSSFDLWQREEQKYWVNVAKKDNDCCVKQQKPAAGIRRTRSRKSSADSSYGRRSSHSHSNSRHPHETFPYDMMFPFDHPHQERNHYTRTTTSGRHVVELAEI